jgi:hypothetical protein
MKHFMVLFALLVGCEGSGVDPSGIDTATATCVKTDVTTAQGCYTKQGTYADFGPNPCEDTKLHPECEQGSCCWNPSTNECFSGISVGSGHMDTYGRRWPTTSCSSSNNIRVDLKPGDPICRLGYGFAYKGDASGGTVCLPCNAAINGPNCTQ